MDTYKPRHEDDLNDLERRLSGWRPGAEGLAADAMLFAAGLAAGSSKRGRLWETALCGVLAALAVGLGAWGLTERAERLALAGRVREPAPSPSVSPPNTVVAPQQPSYTPMPEDYFSLRRQLEQDPNAWLALAQPVGPQAPGPPPPAPAILRAGQLDVLLNR
jgi:hypothetical protein